MQKNHLERLKLSYRHTLGDCRDSFFVFVWDDGQTATVITERASHSVGFQQHHALLIVGLVAVVKQRPLPSLKTMDNFLSQRGAWVARD